MLVLQRKISQSVMIGDNIKVSIVDIGTDKVKIAIEAPKSISIVRSELLDAANSNKEASLSNTNSLDIIKTLIKKQHNED